MAMESERTSIFRMGTNTLENLFQYLTGVHWWQVLYKKVACFPWLALVTQKKTLRFKAAEVLYQIHKWFYLEKQTGKQQWNFCFSGCVSQGPIDAIPKSRSARWYPTISFLRSLENLPMAVWPPSSGSSSLYGGKTDFGFFYPVWWGQSHVIVLSPHFQSSFP